MVEPSTAAFKCMLRGRICPCRYAGWKMSFPAMGFPGNPSSLSYVQTYPCWPPRRAALLSRRWWIWMSPNVIWTWAHFWTTCSGQMLQKTRRIERIDFNIRCLLAFSFKIQSKLLKILLLAMQTFGDKSLPACVHKFWEHSDHLDQHHVSEYQSECVCLWIIGLMHLRIFVNCRKVHKVHFIMPIQWKLSNLRTGRVHVWLEWMGKLFNALAVDLLINFICQNQSGYECAVGCACVSARTLA